MKNTKTLLGIFFILFICKAKAQVDPRDVIASLVPQIGLPLNDIKKTNGIILGGHFQYEQKIASKTRWLAQFGGGLLQGKEYEASAGFTDKYPAVTLVQLRGGLKFFPSGNGFFLAGIAGAAQSHSSGESSIGFSYSPVIGLEFGNVRFFHITIRYDASQFKSYKINTANFSIGYHL